MGFGVRAPETRSCRSWPVLRAPHPTFASWVFPLGISWRVLFCIVCFRGDKGHQRQDLCLWSFDSKPGSPTLWVVVAAGGTFVSSEALGTLQSDSLQHSSVSELLSSALALLSLDQTWQKVGALQP